MYISKLIIENFRTFNKKTEIEFHEGTNVIIGQNNSGKTSVIKALQILFDTNKSNKMTIDDFNRNINIEDFKEIPPKITISAELKESDNEEEFSEELATISTWLTKLEKPYKAQITYEFFLPEKELESYKQGIKNLNTDEYDKFWEQLQNNYLKKYVQKTYVGDSKNKNQVDSESINKFDFQFLTAIRDVERDLFTGKNALLKEVIDFFMDYDIKADQSLSKEEQINLISKKKNHFSQEAQKLIESLQERMQVGKEHMLKYAEDTGASFGGAKPSFDGKMLDTELYSTLKLVVENETGVKLPAIHNGLGYNNLIYISLLLAKMQKDSSGDYLGSNAKVYSILAIEEPEAHLHPNMQKKFLKFLQGNQNSNVKQIFVTSHSPNITSAVELDDLIVLQKIDGNIQAAYPGKVFNEECEEDIKSKNFIKRFIDVTRADIFFAQNLILVEGLAEQLVIPAFSEKMNVDLEGSHTSIINIGGRYFDHFLKLFDEVKSSYAINKKVACITDTDPVRKAKTKYSRWKRCSPLFLDIEPEKYEYKKCSNNLLFGKKRFKEEKIKIFNQEIGESSTFEYDLVLHNVNSESLLVESLSNKNEIKALMEAYDENVTFEEMVNLIENKEIKQEIEKIKNGSKEENIFIEDDKLKRNLIADRYLSSISKGEAAQEITYVISSERIEKQDIVIPKYIEEAIEWIYQ
ncbi:ATP-dependent endonuclease [uncultured Marinococcus sp.]|uniref:ATP-dependent nuclease n=1 Tax=uncultured Marinococcus sp. TaxID=487012 RepID=UPI002601E8D2|nr:AAA family ATPase [uncultured Marinococcus sp.]